MLVLVYCFIWVNIYAEDPEVFILSKNLQDNNKRENGIRIPKVISHV